MPYLRKPEPHKVEHALAVKTHPNENLTRWHSENPDFEKFPENLKKALFWGYCEKVPLSDVVNQLREHRYFKSDAVAKEYLDRLQSLLQEEKKLMETLKTEESPVKRQSAISARIREKIEEGDFLDAELLTLFYTAETNLYRIRLE